MDKAVLDLGPYIVLLLLAVGRRAVAAAAAGNL